MSLARELGKEVFAEGFVDFLRTIIKALTNKGAETAAHAVEERLKADDEWRDEMYADWLHKSEFSKSEKTREGAQGLIRQHAIRDARQDGSEGRMMHTLGFVWKHMGDEHEERIRYLVFYQVLGHLNNEEFENALSAFHDDRNRQWFFTAVKTVGRAIQHTGELVSGVVDNILDTLMPEKFMELDEEELRRLQKHEKSAAVTTTSVGSIANGMARANSWLARQWWAR